MILKNLKYADIRAGDIVIWATDEKLGIPSNSDLVVSVIMKSESIYCTYLELGTLRLWPSRNYHADDACLHMIFRAEP